jgi:hypothetical protein
MIAKTIWVKKNSCGMAAQAGHVFKTYNAILKAGTKAQLRQKFPECQGFRPHSTTIPKNPRGACSIGEKHQDRLHLEGSSKALHRLGRDDADSLPR